MGSRRECTWILGLLGFRVVEVRSESDASDGALRVQVERRGIRRYACSGCGRRTSRVRDMKERTWHDLPWAAHPVTVVYHQRRVRGVAAAGFGLSGSSLRIPRRA